MIKLKPGFHMIATIAVIAAIAEKKKLQRSLRPYIAIILNHSPAITETTHNNSLDIKSSISSAIVVAAIAGEWFPYDR